MKYVGLIIGLMVGAASSAYADNAAPITSASNPIKSQSTQNTKLDTNTARDATAPADPSQALSNENPRAASPAVSPGVATVAGGSGLTSAYGPNH
jgi:hypothetical protein